MNHELQQIIRHQLFSSGHIFRRVSFSRLAWNVALNGTRDFWKDSGSFWSRVMNPSCTARWRTQRWKCLRLNTRLTLAWKWQSALTALHSILCCPPLRIQLLSCNGFGSLVVRTASQFHATFIKLNLPFNDSSVIEVREASRTSLLNMSFCQERVSLEGSFNFTML